MLHSANPFATEGWLSEVTEARSTPKSLEKNVCPCHQFLVTDESFQKPKAASLSRAGLPQETLGQFVAGMVREEGFFSLYKGERCPK